MQRKFALSLFLLVASALTSEATLVWTVSIDDNMHIMTGTGGGPNANFVQENAAINPLPGSPISMPVRQGADNDYYLAGTYNTTIPGNTDFYGPYTPVGTVSANENSAERAFAADDLDLRFHFNLAPADVTGRLLTVTFDANNLDDPPPVGDPANTDLRFGVEIYFNNVRVLDQVIVRPADVAADRDFTTIAFTPASVDARTGPADNIVSLRGINYNASGGGNWMGVDYVRLDSEPIPEPSSALMIFCGALGVVPFLRRRPI
jgi:hypothetical protein